MTMSEDFNYAKQVTDLLKSINEGIWKIEKNTSRIDRRLHFR
jgi:hypothetical protein